MKPIFSSTERGQALILITLAAIGLFAVVGLAIDGSSKFSDRRHAQNAADTAVLAGSLARLRGASDWEDKARDRADVNGYAGDLVRDQVWVYSCNTSKSDSRRSTVPNGIDCGAYEGDPSYIQVVIRSYVNTYFARIIGINRMQNTVSAVAMSQQSYYGELYGGASIVGLAPDQCRTVWLSGSAETMVIGGGIFSNSRLNCGVTIAGSTDIVMDGSIDMVADWYTKNGNPPLGNIAGGLNGGNKGYPYPPPPSMLPNISCSGTATKSGTTMSPGTYSGTFPPAGVTTLQPGTYCVSGSFKLNAGDTLSGSGVTIYMQSGDITWNGGSSVSLTAPSSGDLSGLLIYSPMTNSSTMQFNGNSTSNMTGTILMPAAPVVYNGTGNLTPSHVQIVGYTVELTGANDTNILYDDPSNWDTSTPAQVGMMQ